MRKRRNRWQLVAPALTLLGGGVPTAFSQTVAAVRLRQADEFYEISPAGFDEIAVRNNRGDLDRRPVDPSSREGLSWVGVGDILYVSVNTPDDLKGKVGSAKICYKIREEYTKNCKKHIEHHPRERPIQFESRLQVGHDVKIELILESLTDPNVRIVRWLTTEKIDPIEVAVGSRVRVKFHLAEEEVVFSTRNTLTSREIERHFQPSVNDLRANPNVEMGDSPYSEFLVAPGNLENLTVGIKAVRKQQ